MSWINYIHSTVNNDIAEEKINEGFCFSFDIQHKYNSNDKMDNKIEFSISAYEWIKNDIYYGSLNPRKQKYQHSTGDFIESTGKKSNYFSTKQSISISNTFTINEGIQGTNAFSNFMTILNDILSTSTFSEEQKAEMANHLSSNNLWRNKTNINLVIDKNQFDNISKKMRESNHGCILDKRIGSNMTEETVDPTSKKNITFNPKTIKDITEADKKNKVTIELDRLETEEEKIELDRLETEEEKKKTEEAEKIKRIKATVTNLTESVNKISESVTEIIENRPSGMPWWLTFIIVGFVVITFIVISLSSKDSQQDSTSLYEEN